MIPLIILKATSPAFMQMLIIPRDKVNLPLVTPMLFRKVCGKVLVVLTEMC